MFETGSARTPYQLLEASKGLIKWRDYNRDLLQSMFTNHDLMHEYDRSCLPSRAARDDFDAAAIQFETFGRQINKIESI
ncbi:MAG TPA: hypothetical protein VIM52_10325, partial [Stellaceae bacterium]